MSTRKKLVSNAVGTKPNILLQNFMAEHQGSLKSAKSPFQPPILSSQELSRPKPYAQQYGRIASAGTHALNRSHSPFKPKQ